MARENEEELELIRLNKFLSHNSNYSRREADKIIEEGRVTINGKEVTNLATKVTAEDLVKIGKRVIKSDKNRIALNLGFHYFLQGKKAYKDRDHKTAINYFLESKKIFKKQNELISLADVLNSEGILFHTTGDPKKALKAHNEALKLYIHLKLDFKVANSYLNLSMVYQDSMQIQKGRENIEKSILISEKNKFHSLLSDSYKELGILYKNDGKNDLAEKNLNKALASYKKFKNQEGIAFCYGNLGIINLLKGKFKESIKFHSDALDIFADLNNNWGIANEKANVGNLNCILGKEIGFKQLDEALNMHKKIGYQYGVATDLKLIGFHQFNGKDTVRSIKNLEKSRQILLKLENLKEADYIKSWIDKIKASN